MTAAFTPAAEVGGRWSLRRLPLPRGRPLPEASWRRRHEAIVMLLAGHVLGILVFGVVRGYGVRTVALATLPIAIAALAAHLSSESRTFATAVAALGLMSCSAVILQLAGGTVEANFHVFVMLGVVSLYQDWVPFGLATVFVIAHHGIVGVLNPRAVYSTPAAWAHPVRWAAIHAGFVLAMGAVNLVSWRLAEAATDQIADLSQRNEMLLNAAGEGIYGTDEIGRATFVNPAAARMFGFRTEELLGVRLHELVHHTRSDGSPYPVEECPIQWALLQGTDHRVTDEVFWCKDGASFPVEYASTPIRVEGHIVGAVVTFDDISARQAADEAQRELSRLAELEHAQSEVLHRLQETVRPPKPVVPNTELGVHYLPADDTSPAGGDLYDWVLLPDGDLYFAVIDVAGKGVTATKDALSVAHALRLSMLAGRPLSELVVNASTLLTAQNPELVATVLVGRYSPVTGVTKLAGASHPPALHVTAAGEVREIYAPGIAIGWPAAGSHDVAEVKLERNDSLILYTDGLVEATKDIDAGLATAAREAASVSRYPADLLARSLVERMLAAGTRRDDTLAMVLRRRTPPEIPGHALGPFEHRFSAAEAVVPLARHLLDDWLQHQPVDIDEVEDIPLVVSELCTNAVRAARSEVVLRAWADGNSLVIEVEDDGGEPPELANHELEPEVPDTDLERGRGLFLAETLSDEMTVTVEDGRTRIRVVKRSVLGETA